MRSLLAILPAFAGVALAVGCPYAGGDPSGAHSNLRRDGNEGNGNVPGSTEQFLEQFYENDGEGTVMTSDVGMPMGDQNSLKAGERGPTLLEDFIFRQKIQHFDHERVPERAVHARGAGKKLRFRSLP
jgi:catalase